MFRCENIEILWTCKCLTVKRWRFSQKELEVVPKGKGLTKKYKFNQEQLEVVPKGKGLTKKYKFNQK